jgi:hypothetical protein
LTTFTISNVQTGNYLDNNGATNNGAPIVENSYNGTANQQWNLVQLSNGSYSIINAQSGDYLDDPWGSTANGTKLQQWQNNGGYANQQWKVTPLSNGNYDIVAWNGLYVDAQWQLTANGTQVQQWQYNGGYTNQQWVLHVVTPPSNLNGQTFTISNVCSNEYLDNNSSLYDAASIVQNRYTGGQNQQWKMVQLSNGNYNVVNVQSGKNLDDAAFSTANGNGMIQWYNNGGLNQQWKPVLLPNGNYNLINAYSHLYLDDYGYSTANGAFTCQWQYNGGINNQQWVLHPLTTAPISGTVTISNAYSGKYLDNNSSPYDWAPVVQNQYTGGQNQQWNLVQLSDGNYNVVNAKSGLDLNDCYASTADWTGMIQYHNDGTLAGEWKLVQLCDGNYNVVNAKSGLYLDSNGWAAANGTQVIQYHGDGALNQEWVLHLLTPAPVPVPSSNPTANTPYSPAPAGVPLFNGGGPSYLDVQQGQVGDCWLLGSLAEVAARAPQDITSMFTYDGTTVENGATVGVYSVRFFESNGSAVHVVVDTELPSGGSYYAHIGNALGTQVLWVALAEKAYVVASSYGYVGAAQTYQNSYSAINGGWPSTALQAITGKPASENYTVNPSNIAAAWNAGQLIVMDTGTPVDSHIVGPHVYAVVGYNPASSQPYELYNPWGTTSATATPTSPGWAPGAAGVYYGLFWASPTTIVQNFDAQSTGTGAINAIGAVSEPTTLITLDNVLDTIIRHRRPSGH